MMHMFLTKSSANAMSMAVATPLSPHTGFEIRKSSQLGDQRAKDVAACVSKLSSGLWRDPGLKVVLSISAEGATPFAMQVNMSGAGVPVAPVHMPPTPPHAARTRPYIPPSAPPTIAPAPHIPSITHSTPVAIAPAAARSSSAGPAVSKRAAPSSAPDPASAPKRSRFTSLTKEQKGYVKKHFSAELTSKECNDLAHERSQPGEPLNGVSIKAVVSYWKTYRTVRNVGRPRKSATDPSQITSPAVVTGEARGRGGGELSADQQRLIRQYVLPSHTRDDAREIARELRDKHDLLKGVTSKAIIDLWRTYRDASTPARSRDAAAVTLMSLSSRESGDDVASEAGSRPSGTDEAGNGSNDGEGEEEEEEEDTGHV